MQLTLNIPNEKLYHQIVWLLSRFKSDGVEIKTDASIQKRSPDNKGLDFSAFHVESFKEMDGLAYQKQSRDEW